MSFANLVGPLFGLLQKHWRATESSQGEYYLKFKISELKVYQFNLPHNRFYASLKYFSSSPFSSRSLLLTPYPLNPSFIPFAPSSPPFPSLSLPQVRMNDTQANLKPIAVAAIGHLVSSLETEQVE